ncbi:4-hydroxy-2-oxoheptanedioate aldolase [Vibrio sp. HN007]|uniref:4-hydroxy-2-oxoheptanedioate aldolase n=1 Tax=Vibrio iocasae TaxID=3098914 RepID=UPI0035D3FFB8
MMLPENKFKKALKGDQPLWGLWLGLPDSTCAEICAGAGFDWLLIDGEHAPFELKTTMHHLHAMAPYDVSPIVRPEDGNVATIKRLLDIGAQTLLIPMVNTAEEARELVKAVRYPPEGIRGMGSSLARAARWNKVPEYLKKANEEICLLVQVETLEAMENLEEIVQVEGVDGVFIGPSDLSGAMGHVGNPDHPEVAAKIEWGMSVIQKSGKASGILSLNLEKAQHYAESGTKFVGVGVDTLLLRLGAEQLANKVKNKSQQTQSASSGY